MKTVELNAKVREEKGKNQVKKLRTEGYVPAVIYGDSDPELISVKPGDVLKSFRQSNYKRNVLFTIKTDSGENTVIAREISKHPITNELKHIDFVRVREDKKIVVKVPVNLVGTSQGQKFGGVLLQVRKELRLSCFPQDIKDILELDVTDMEIGSIRRIQDVPIPEKSEIVANPQFVVARIEAPRVEKVSAVDDDLTEEAGEPAEGGEETAAAESNGEDASE